MFNRRNSEAEIVGMRSKRYLVPPAAAAEEEGELRAEL
jgi:hypothetical protein